MTTNQIYDIIVIGASKEGIEFCKQLLSKVNDIKVALVSRNFNRPIDLSAIELINREVIFSTYNRGLLSITLDNKTNLFTKNIVIATGTKPIKSTLKNNNIQYNLNNLKVSKSTPAIVFGSDNLAASYAITLSKKFKYIYLCTNSLDLKCDQKYIKKIENIANIVHLPNCNIVACKNDKDGNLAEVQLDTYSSIRCTALFMSIGRTPDTSGMSKRMIEIDSEGYIITKEFNETTKVPNIFAIGSCTKAKHTHSISSVVNTIISRNNFRPNN